MDKPESDDQRPLHVNYNMREAPTQFVDYVQVEAGSDNVHLNMIQFLPSTSTSDTQQAQIVSRSVLTWQHFCRVVGMLNQVLMDNQEGATKFFLDTVEQIPTDRG